MGIIRGLAAPSMNTFQDSRKSPFSSASIILPLGNQASRLKQLSDPCNHVGLVEPCMANLPTFCFVIPCFNEEDNVGPTVGSVREAMGGRGDYEIVLVNDAQHRSYLGTHAGVSGPPIPTSACSTTRSISASVAKAATATSVMMRVCWWNLACCRLQLLPTRSPR
jgi:cellulose synthase/poly-beta-1,6-N-acetylglucosamine synthase-like glycosyltransferase